MKIRYEQLEILRQQANERYLAKISAEIEEKMQLRIPKAIRDYEQKQLQFDIRDALVVAENYGIDDPDQLFDWCVIRIVSKQRFYQMDEFKDILEHRFLTPFAKARHLILIFFTILDMQREGYPCVRQ
jgi:hypothetical protein